MTDTDDFSSLKRSSKDSLKSYAEEAKKLNTTYQADERFWSLTTDKAGNGRAIIRFLPPIKGESSPFVKYFSHSFEHTPKNWYIENCPTTLDGKPCPMCEHNSELWAKSGDSKDHPNKALVRKQKRKLYYVSNIYVVEDDANPENNGKVFLFRYGKKLFERVQLSMEPQYKNEKAVNPFDLWEGANLVLKQRIVDNYPNFELSTFESPKPLLDDDAEMKAVWLKQYPLKPIVSPENFKSYEALKARRDKVFGFGKQKVVTEDQVEDNSPPFDVDDEPAPAAKKKATAEPKKAAKATNPEDFFKELMEDDE